MTVYNYLQYDFSGDSDPLAAKSWMKYLTPLQHELQSRVYVKLHHWKTNIINKGNHTHPSWSHSQIKLSMKPLGATDPERLVRVPIIRVFHHPVRLPGRPFYRPCFPPVWFEHQVLSTIPVRAIHFPPTRPCSWAFVFPPPPFVFQGSPVLRRPRSWTFRIFRPLSRVPRARANTPRVPGRDAASRPHRTCTPTTSWRNTEWGKETPRTPRLSLSRPPPPSRPPPALASAPWRPSQGALPVPVPRQPIAVLHSVAFLYKKQDAWFSSLQGFF